MNSIEARELPQGTIIRAIYHEDSHYGISTPNTPVGPLTNGSLPWYSHHGRYWFVNGEATYELLE